MRKAGRPPPLLEVVDQPDQPGRERRLQSMQPGDLDDRRQERVDLGPPPAHRQIAPDAAMALGRAAVEGDHVGERALERRGPALRA